MQKIILLALLFVASASVWASDLQLSKGKRSNYTIVVSGDASADTRYAAAELQKYIEQMSGARLKMADKAARSRNIILSQNEGLAPQSFVISVDRDNVVIEGQGRGVVYAVYELLERWGCRLYAADALVIPQKSELVLPENFKARWSPTFTFRDTFYIPTRDALYIDWHRQSHNTEGEKEEWGMWVHTMFRLCPPKEYFESHPEYFALRDGKRVATQLCLSNFDVLGIVTENLEKAIAANPKAKYWSVSPEDNFGYCQCEECEAMNAVDGSATGSVIQFVDKIAEAFPDKVISTLAYQYSRAAPKATLPRDNVNIMFCNIECNRSQAIADDPSSASFVTDMRDWAATTKNILVWDYIIQFKNLVSPFPNFHTLQPNIKFFVDNNVVAIFEQGNREVGGEFAALRSYVVSKLLVDPNASTDALINEFCNGYYGDGGRYVKQYIDLITNNLIRSGAELRIFGSPCDSSAVGSWLSAENLDNYQSIFDMAEKAVAADSTLLRRVRIARQPLYYAQLEQAKLDPYGQRGMFVMQGGQWVTSPRFADMLTMFIERCKDEGVTLLSEWHTTPDEYLTMMRDAATMTAQGSLSFQKGYQVSAAPLARYGRGLDKNLTDGIRGTNDYKLQWLGWDAPVYSVVVDLGQTQPIESVEAHFMQQLSDWIFYPTAITVSASVDGVKFKPVGRVDNAIDKTVNTASKSLVANAVAGSEGRYVKVEVTGVGVCPTWHLGAGGKALTFMDEITVR